MHQIRDMLACARHHLHLYTVPSVKVLFVCSQPVPKELIEIVEDSGAKVITNIADKLSDEGSVAGEHWVGHVEALIISASIRARSIDEAISFFV